MICDVVVAGGGLAGSAAAIGLARAGRHAVLIERETGPHDKVCGEFLSYEACHYLSALGINPEALGAIALHGVRLVKGTQCAQASLPFRALSLSRRVLDEELLNAAIASGVDVRRGLRVKALTRSGTGWQAMLDQGPPLEARAAFLATGKHDLKDLKRPAGSQPDLIGFKMYWQLSAKQALSLGGHVELALFPGGYAGLEPVEGNRANLCLLVQRGHFGGLENSWDALLDTIKTTCPHVAHRLEGAKPLLAKPLAISAIPYGYVLDGFERRDDQPWRLGDQAAVIPSFSGDGMSIALHSARLASDFYMRGEQAHHYHARLASDVHGQIARATRLSKTLVNPWGQRAAITLARLMPPVLTGIASWTRISDRALERGISRKA